MNGSTQRPKLGIFPLTMLNLAIVCSLRGLPMVAEEGFSLVFYLFIAAILFLIPVSLISAELATGWPPHGPGGVYIWVKEAFGPKWGFLAIWLQWIQNVVWFPTVLSFIGATIAYAYDPALANNKFYMMALILVVFWGGTFLNFRGMKASGLLSAICVIAGTIVPGILIVVLGIIWTLSGAEIAITISWDSMFPDIRNIHNVVFLAGAVLIFSGMEVSAAHSEDIINPKYTYPRAILLAAGAALTVLMFGALAIAVVVPQKELSLVAGVMETFSTFFNAHGLRPLVPFIAVLIATGSIGELSAWIIGPAKGLFASKVDGHLPPFLQRVNKKLAPTGILLVQGVVVTILSTIFLFMPTVSSSYWILTAFSVLLYLIMYIFLFVAAIHLRYSKPEIERAYKIPGGNIVMWLVAGSGMLGALFTFIIGFLPPSQIDTGNIIFYEAFLIGGIIIMCGAPLIMMRSRTKKR
jgi:putative glutamate/gamma-aminobutyrate antiporter